MPTTTTTMTKKDNGKKWTRLNTASETKRESVCVIWRYCLISNNDRAFDNAFNTIRHLSHNIKVVIIYRRVVASVVCACIYSFFCCSAIDVLLPSIYTQQKSLPFWCRLSHRELRMCGSVSVFHPASIILSKILWLALAFALCLHFGICQNHCKRI